MYGIINKQTKEFFKGFDSKNNPVWTADSSKAWTGSKLVAKCQAELLNGSFENVQQKPVLL